MRQQTQFFRSEAPRATWTIPRSHVRARVRIVLPTLLAFAATAFFVKEAWEALLIVGMAAALGVTALVYALGSKERTYALWSEGVVVRTHAKPARFRPWSSFAGYQTHAEATSRRYRGLAREASDKLGETFILEARSTWRFGMSLPTTPETEEEVRRALAAALPHRPGTRISMLVILLALGLVIAAGIVAFFVTR